MKLQLLQVPQRDSTHKNRKTKHNSIHIQDEEKNQNRSQIRAQRAAKISETASNMPKFDRFQTTPIGSNHVISNRQAEQHKNTNYKAKSTDR